MANWRISASEVGASKVVKAFVWLVVLGVVGYSEVLYLGIIGNLFPPGVLYVACLLGAFCTGISVICLYAGKSVWFRPGTQLIAAWGFTVVEVVVLVMNDILAQAIRQQATIDQYLSLYKFCVPAVPVLALVGWGILFALDPAQKVKHARMEMADEQAEMQLQFEREQFDAKMEVQRQALDIMKQQLAAEIASQASIAHIQMGATRVASDAIKQLTGINPIAKQLTGPPPVSISQDTGPIQIPMSNEEMKQFAKNPPTSK